MIFLKTQIFTKVIVLFSEIISMESDNKSGKPTETKITDEDKHCDQCFKTFSSKSAKVAHPKHDHDTTSEKRYKCDKCQKKSFAYKGGLTKHDKFKHQNVRFNCEFCGKNFRQNGVHQGIKSHFCGICSKSFGIAGELRRHVKITHSDSKSLSCDQCEKSFKILSMLKIHKKVCS